MIRSPKLLTPALTTIAMVAALVAPVAASTGVSRVVQLGDSYSAGYGVLDEDRGGAGGDCLEEGFFDSSAVPGGRLASALDVPLEFLACGGAEIEDVVDQFHEARPSIPGDGTGTVVVFTAGGNDVRSIRGEMWTDVLTRCIIWDFSCERRSANQLGNLDEVASEMGALVEMIATSAPRAQVRVLGYPELFQRSPFCFGVTGIDRNEASFLDGLASELNNALEDAVNEVAADRDVDISWVDVEHAFDDHGACQTERSGERYVNDTEFVPRSFRVQLNSFHPTTSGYDAYSAALNASL